MVISVRARIFMLMILAVGFVACSVSGATLELTPAPAPTPTPRFVALPPTGILVDMITEEVGKGYQYLPWHYVAEDVMVWLLFGWPETDDVCTRPSSDRRVASGCCWRWSQWERKRRRH